MNLVINYSTIFYVTINKRGRNVMTEFKVLDSAVFPIIYTKTKQIKSLQ